MNKKSVIERIVSHAHANGAFTGTWLYAERGEIVTKGAVGFCDAADTLPLREDSIFYLASVSKQFTATAVMLARRMGLLDLDDDVTKFFPDLPFGGVTIRHMLIHTSGLPYYENWSAATAKKENVIPDNGIAVRFLRESGKGPVFAPGEKFGYCNTAYCLLAQTVQVASGVPFEEFMKTNVFEPAGMYSTQVCHTRKDGIAIPNMAYGLVPHDGGYILADESGPDEWVIWLDGGHGAGHVYSNIFDLFAWDRALKKETVLTREEQQMMYTPGLLNDGRTGGFGDDKEEIGYGFGWDILKYPRLGLAVSHGGDYPGYRTLLRRFVDADRVLVILSCRDAKDAKAFEKFMSDMKSAAAED
ncbi:MAG: beta-lactamase family protein [Clostridia bacterium]|nr:beta-lactamase family protein [Clostridia bacterium]